jgi:hypothetical protein
LYKLGKYRDATEDGIAVKSEIWDATKAEHRHTLNYKIAASFTRVNKIFTD